MKNQNEGIPEEISEFNVQKKILNFVLMVSAAIIIVTLDYTFKLGIDFIPGTFLTAIVGSLSAWLINSYLESRKFREFNNNAIDFIKNSENEKAIRQFELAVYLRSKSPALHYNLAWLYSLEENKEKSLMHLYSSQNCGLINLKEKIEKNEKLEFIKKQPEFLDFFNKLR